MRHRLIAATFVVPMIIATVGVAEPAVAARAAASIACVPMESSTFSDAQVAAALQFWTPQRMAEANVLTATPVGASGRATPGADTTPPPADELPTTSTECVDPASAASEAPGVTRDPSLLPAAVGPAAAGTAGPTATDYWTVGELYLKTGSNRTWKCTASTINPPGSNPRHLQNLLLTAAHCIRSLPAPPTMLMFAPHYTGSNSFPLGEWGVKGVITNPGWTRCTSGCAEYDYGFAILAYHNGQTIGNIVSVNGWNVNEPNTMVGSQIVGYPKNTPFALVTPKLAITRVVTCRDDNHNHCTSSGTGSLYRKAENTPGFTDGTSGSPFFASYDFTAGWGWIYGDLGGFQAGGATDTPSYSSYWTIDFSLALTAALNKEYKLL